METGSTQPLLLNATDYAESISITTTTNVRTLIKRQPWRIVLYGLFNFSFFAVVFPLMFVILPSRASDVTSSSDAESGHETAHKHSRLGKGSVLGLVMMFGNIVVCVLAPLIGRLSDFVCRRKPFVFAGTCLLTGGMIAIVLVETFIELSFAFVLLCSSVAVAVPAYAAMLPDVIDGHTKADEQLRNTISSIVNGLGQVGGACGAIASLFLPIRLICFAAAGLALVCGILTMLAWPEARTSPKLGDVGARRSDGGGLMAALRSLTTSLRLPAFRIYLLAVFLLASGDTAFTSFLEYYLRDVTRSFELVGGLKVHSAHEAASLFTVIDAVSAIVGAASAKLFLDKLGKRMSFFIAGLCMCSAAIVPLVRGSYLFVACAAVLYGYGYGMSFTCEWAFVSDLLAHVKSDTGSATYAADAGLWQSILLSPKIFVPVLYGSIVDHFADNGEVTVGYDITYGLACGQFLLAALVIWFVRSKGEL